MTVPAAPRMSAELRAWCLPMTALRTRSNSAKRSCTTSWRSSRFSEGKKKKEGTSSSARLSREYQEIQLSCIVCNHKFSSIGLLVTTITPHFESQVSQRQINSWHSICLCHTHYLTNTLSFWNYETLLSSFVWPRQFPSGQKNKVHDTLCFIYVHDCASRWQVGDGCGWATVTRLFSVVAA